MTNNLKLTEDQTSGTRTVHLPLFRSVENPPRMTLVFARDDSGEEGSFMAGLAVCSINDPFIKAVGRKIAFHRLVGKPIVGTPAELRSDLIEHLSMLELNRPGTIGADLILDLNNVLSELPARFERMEKAMEAAAEAAINCSGEGC